MRLTGVLIVALAVLVSSASADDDELPTFKEQAEPICKASAERASHSMLGSTSVRLRRDIPALNLGYRKLAALQTPAVSLVPRWLEAVSLHLQLMRKAAAALQTGESTAAQHLFSRLSGNSAHANEIGGFDFYYCAMGFYGFK
jgi:hypothetical protein